MPYVPIEWLREHVDVPSGTTAAQLAADLVKVGLEEERIVPPAVTGPPRGASSWMGGTCRTPPSASASPRA